MEDDKDETRKAVLEKLQAETIEISHKNGAIPGSVTTSHEETPLSYIPGYTASRFIIKAIGELNITNLVEGNPVEIDPEVIKSLKVDDEPFVEEAKDISEEDRHIQVPEAHTFEVIDGIKYWVIEENDFEALSIGCGILGTGGGASPYLSSLVCKKVIK